MHAETLCVISVAYVPTWFKQLNISDNVYIFL